MSAVGEAVRARLLEELQGVVRRAEEGSPAAADMQVIRALPSGALVARTGDDREVQELRTRDRPKGNHGIDKAAEGIRQFLVVTLGILGVAVLAAAARALVNAWGLPLGAWGLVSLGCSSPIIAVWALNIWRGRF